MLNFFRTKAKSYTDLSNEDFKNGMMSKDAVIIDVRTAGEFQSGKIKGTRNIDMMGSGFSGQIQNLQKKKTITSIAEAGIEVARLVKLWQIWVLKASITSPVES